MFGSRRSLRTAAGVGAITVVLAGMIISESRADPSPQVRAGGTAGALSIDNSRPNRSVLTGRQMLPGDVVSGRVTISNSGSGAGLFELSAAGLTDVPGDGGGRLSDDLRLVITAQGGAAPSAVVYDGTLGDLDVVPVGELGSGADRTFTFTVTRALHGAVTDRAASTEVEFDWAAVREASGPCANRILGSDRADVLTGSRAGDAIAGGPGNDTIVGGPGEDCLDGEAGDDRIDARDGQADRVDCGPGDDTVLADPRDVTVGCEHRIVTAAPAP